jgi:hypothetical protein
MAEKHCGYSPFFMGAPAPFCFVSDAPHDSPLMAILWQY